MRRTWRLSSLWLALPLLVGCVGQEPDGGASGGAVSAAVSRFLGVWEFSSGRITERCNDERSASDNLAGVILAIDPGKGSKVVMREAGNCNMQFQVDGDRATVLPDQKCPLSGGSETDGSYKGDITFHVGSMVLLGDELTMAHSYELYVKWQSGANLRCFGEKLGTLQRTGN
jgi:hypothetical protein